MSTVRAPLRRDFTSGIWNSGLAIKNKVSWTVLEAVYWFVTQQKKNPLGMGYHILDSIGLQLRSVILIAAMNLSEAQC